MNTNSAANADAQQHDVDDATSDKEDPARKKYRFELAKRCRDARGAMKAGDVSQALNVHRNTIWNIENGKKVPDAFELIQLAKLYGVSPTFLLTGHRGEAGTQDAVEKSLRSVEQGAYVYVPHFDIAVSAGHGHEFDNIETVKAMRPFDAAYIRGQLNVRHDDLVLVSIVGNSMEPKLSSRDTVMIDLRQRDAYTEGLHMIRLDGALLMKKLQRLPGRVLRVSSENPAYEPFDIVGSEDTERDFSIIGRALWGGVTFH